MSGRVGGRLAKLRRIQDLFVAGRVVTLTAEGGEKVHIFVCKPSAFERDEASKDGRAGRAKRVLHFDTDQGEQAVVEAKLAELTSEEIIQALVAAKGNDHYVKAMDEIRAKKDWQEKLEALDRGRSLLEDQERAETPDEDARSRMAEEREFFRALNLEYLKAIDEAVTKLNDEYSVELGELDSTKLAQEYQTAYREMAGTQAFLEERRITELWYAVRDCEATEDEGKPDGFDHSKCNSHLTKLADQRFEVYSFPDALIQEARMALDDLNMSPQDAAFSAAPTSSSASSGQPDTVEDSTVSTPAETSPVPVGT